MTFCRRPGRQVTGLTRVFTSFGGELNFNNCDLLAVLWLIVYSRYSLHLHSPLAVSAHSLSICCFRHNSVHFYTEKGPVLFPL